ncbi:hypothetical protein V5O48_015463 [Marasmius crinis-equi]|uniref:Uncharacterized protein n=1 Tax=Marasmius crinis-equi TaxID=585013 RepID=A0ABR3EUG6_9AGAR
MAGGFWLVNAATRNRAVLNRTDFRAAIPYTLFFPKLGSSTYLAFLAFLTPFYFVLGFWRVLGPKPRLSVEFFDSKWPEAYLTHSNPFPDALDAAGGCIERAMVVVGSGGAESQFAVSGIPAALTGVPDLGPEFGSYPLINNDDDATFLTMLRYRSQTEKGSGWFTCGTDMQSLSKALFSEIAHLKPKKDSRSGVCSTIAPFQPNSANLNQNPGRLRYLLVFHVEYAHRFPLQTLVQRRQAEMYKLPAQLAPYVQVAPYEDPAGGQHMLFSTSTASEKSISRAEALSFIWLGEEEMGIDVCVQLKDARVSEELIAAKQRMGEAQTAAAEGDDEEYKHL